MCALKGSNRIKMLCSPMCLPPCLHVYKLMWLALALGQGRNRGLGDVGCISSSVWYAPSLEGSYLQHGTQLLVDFLTEVRFKHLMLDIQHEGSGRQSVIAREHIILSRRARVWVFLVFFPFHIYKLKRSNPCG